MDKYLQFVLCITSIIYTGCKQAYFPKLDEAQKMLVVDGLLTDESNIITVRLSNAVPFRDQAFLPEQKAILIVSDDLGRVFDFEETESGVYESKSFQYEYGRTYSLFIKTSKNKYYRSYPQTLFPKSELDSVRDVITTETLQTTKNGKLILRTLPGLEFSVLLKNSSTSSPYFRFSNTVLVEYREKQTYDFPADTLPELFDCWRKYFPNQSFNLSEPVNSLSEHRHTLSFCPNDTSYFSIVYEYHHRDYPLSSITYNRYLYQYVFTVKKYHINKDVHQYYKDINDQLEANNRIFDPVSFQVRGNITCDNDPEEPVLGIFEVASTSIRSYTFIDFHLDPSGRFKEIEPFDMDKIPYEGKWYNHYPPFWIYQ